MEIRFDMTTDETSEVLYVMAKILLSVQNENNNRIFEQRVQYFQMDQSTREQIIHYIFQIQRKNRMKELGLE